ncbi:hypothetical protein [Porcipelethomonas sp.]|uniref:hypothetical protein n=1 Tax=Porcipelethomonas sp. TaxID=2981675 RepID=UPI003EF66A28
MIKGVNKKVLEINNPQSIYFEKAVLYLKPNMGSAPEKLIRREADDLIRSMSPKPPRYAVWLKGFVMGAAIVSILSVSGYFIFTAIF